MSEITSVQCPTLNYQLDPLLSVSPLIDLYSNCLTHVVDTDGLFHLSSHTSPIILSHKTGIFRPSSSYQKGFVAVRSARCLLTIAALFIPRQYNAKELLNYIVPTGYNFFAHGDIPTSRFVKIYPQFFMILTNQSIHSLKIDRKPFPRWAFCADYRSLFISLQLDQDSKNVSRISGDVAHEFSDITFNCSTLSSCGKEIQLMIPVIEKFFHGSQKFEGFGMMSTDENPFSRGARAGILEAVDNFILGRRSKINTLGGTCRPLLARFSIPSAFATKEVIPAGRTPVVKFVTTAGVFTPKSSHLVYFSPFLPKVWLGILISAGVTVATIVGVIQMQGSQEEHKVGLVSLTVELVTWIFAAAIGQYKHSDIPLVSGRLCSGVIWIVAPVVLAWFVLSAFLVNVYSAIFSSGATKSFYYVTNYTDFFQLPPDVSVYIMLNESYVSWDKGQKPNKNCIPADITTFCYAYKQIPAACTIYSAISSAYFRLTVDQTSIIAAKTDPNWHKVKQQRQQEKRLKFWKLYNGSKLLLSCIECITDVLLGSQKPIAFLISDHDFQNYWELFVQVMEKHPSVKIANSYESDDSFLSEPVTFELNSGLHHPKLKGSVVARMKILLTSGIYGLWEKWQRIKFTDGGLLHAQKTLCVKNRIERLSFDNSGTSWLFQGLAFVLAVSAGIFCGEIILKFCVS